MTMLDVEDVHHSAGYSCCSVRRCNSTAIGSMRTVTRRSGNWWMSAVWKTCWRDEENLLVNNRQLMCMIRFVRKERIAVMKSNSVLLFVDKRRCVLGIHNSVSMELVMSDRISVGDYELLEKQNEGYKTS